MPKSKIEMVENMRIAITEMSELLEWAHVENVLSVPEYSENLTVDFIRIGFKWINILYETAYINAMKIWKLLPRDTWIRYATWGQFAEHRESVLLTERLMVLRKAVRAKSRPDFFKKGKINAKIKAYVKKRDGKKNSKTNRRVPQAK